MMIAGVGTDIVEIARIRSVLHRFGERFTQKILSEKEYRQPDGQDRYVSYIAKQFAAKEAISKALGSGMQRGVHFRSIEVTRLESGMPVVKLLAHARDFAEKQGIGEVKISMSDEKEYAVAFAVALTR